LKNYDKNIPKAKFPKESIRTAICHARLRDSPPCKNWPEKFGSTTVYRLVENIISDNDV
jgi:hypothetical protein